MTLEMIFQLVIAILGAIITIAIIPMIKQKVDADKINQALEMVEIAVNAAEQIYNRKGQGIKKKKYVLERLEKLGINISEEELNMMIESSVNELNNWKKQLNQS